MKGKIGLEEHFAIDDTLNDSKGFFPDNIWVEVRERILDLHGRRLRLMDEFGMEMMILSLNAPAVQAIPDIARANDMAIDLLKRRTEYQCRAYGAIDNVALRLVLRQQAAVLFVGAGKGALKVLDVLGVGHTALSFNVLPASSRAIRALSVASPIFHSTLWTSSVHRTHPCASKRAAVSSLSALVWAMPRCR